MKLVTHGGSFHTDDVFACATLQLYLEKQDIKYEIFRTKDKSIIEGGDIVFDVGGKYDGEKYFDHHQKETAGKRDNGILYASFGLIWKHYGPELVGST